jgi:kynurenine formamidase
MPPQPTPRRIDLSHLIEDGMITYKGLPAPIICDHLSFVQSRAKYAPGTEFTIGRIEMIANTGTYIDAPYHRYPDGDDIAALSLERDSGLDGIVVRVAKRRGRAIDATAFDSIAVKGRAVLVHTGWDQHWGTQHYLSANPFLTHDAAETLVAAGAALVGIDSLNIDDIGDRSRPAHSLLLGAEIPIVEHLRGLAQLPARGFRFSAVPPKVAGFGTWPVRAYALMP